MNKLKQTDVHQIPAGAGNKTRQSSPRHNENENITTLYEHPFEQLRKHLLEAYQHNPDRLVTALKDSLQRLLQHKEFMIHANVLDSKVLQASYHSLTRLEKNIADRGVDTVSAAITSLDALLLQNWSENSVNKKDNG